MPHGDPEQSRYALQQALLLVKGGYRLTPVTITRGATKKKRAEFHRGWRHEGSWSADPEQIKAWWTDHPDCSFAIGCRANGIEGVDLDVHHSDEIDAVMWWDREGLPGSQFAVNTASGGMHLIWRVRPDGPRLPQEAGVTLGRGVDTRGAGDEHNAGGLFFAAGAHIVGEEGSYVLAAELPPLDELGHTPDAVLALFQDQKPRAAEYGRSGEEIEHDQDWIYNAVTEQLGRVAAHDPGAGGFRYLLMGAAMVIGRYCEMGQATVEDGTAALRGAVESVWGSCNDDDLEWIATGMYDGPATERWTLRAAPDPLAATAPDPGTVADELERETLKELLRLRARRAAVERLDAEQAVPLRPLADIVVWDGDLDSMPLPCMAITELMPDRAVGWLGGPSGAYKSFVMVSLAVALAYGRPALGHEQFTPRRSVKTLYVAGEGSAGVALRIRALRHRLGIATSGRIGLYPRAVDLTDPAAVDMLIACVIEQDIEHLFIDTFRQTTLGVNENDNTEVGVILARLLALRDDHGVSSTLADHTNKSIHGLADLGGAGAKRANADYVLMVDLPNGSREIGAQRRLRVAKLKDLADGASWPIRLEAVPDVVDADGNASAVVVVGEVPAAVVDIHGDHAWRDVRLPDGIVKYAGPGREDLLRVAQLVIHYGSGESGISRAEVLRLFRADTPDVTADNSLKRVTRAWDALHALRKLEPVSPTGSSKTTAHRWIDDPQ